jgi:hypothetical protein
LESTHNGDEIMKLGTNNENKKWNKIWNFCFGIILFYFIYRFSLEGLLVMVCTFGFFYPLHYKATLGFALKIILDNF